MVIPDRKRTLLVTIGASRFPKAPELGGGSSFSRSAEALLAYFLGDDGFGLDRRNLLDLFDASHAAAQQLEEIAEFLDDKQRSVDANTLPKNLLIYYVGHGLFTPTDRKYCLALRCTNASNIGFTAMRGRDLAEVVRNGAMHLRRFLILDCCFAGSMLGEFLSGPGEAANIQMIEDLPDRGTSLLCASSSQDVALAPARLDYTMFTDALLKVLNDGNPTLGEHLSMSDLKATVQNRLRNNYPLNWVRPEVHSPDMRRGDISSVPLFPNRAWPQIETRKKAEAEAERLAEIEAQNKAEAEAERLAEIEARKTAAAEAERLAEIEAQKTAAAEAKRPVEEVEQIHLEQARNQVEPPHPARTKIGDITWRVPLSVAVVVIVIVMVPILYLVIRPSPATPYNYDNPAVTAAENADPLYGSECLEDKATSCYKLGLRYDNGDGVAKNPDIAAVLYQKACNGDELAGCTHLGFLYDKGYGVAKNAGTAASLFEKACHGNEFVGCVSLGVLYATGNGIAKDESEAVTLYQKACDGHESTGCFNLAFAYAEGNGVTKDVGRASALYQKACDADKPLACVNLGTLYVYGSGVTKDFRRAAILYQKACDGNIPSGCQLLAQAYEKGNGVPSNLTKAKLLYKQVCDWGDSESCDKLKLAKFR
ncbi:tetratricopeptide repeat protein [Tunturiibacter gelidoferens]|uniref:TPR repeat protein n=1 Tax=Tunturiibacter gelidiferens TaxID=3069689 RepID=A0ACC5NVC5_9BACT|nr:tetratricopeptide repeat protein [Edaphobacter lichenicola]MBB5338394.1 TPR repeat protein [Edaphobacter lichenicola]